MVPPHCDRWAFSAPPSAGASPATPPVEKQDSLDQSRRHFRTGRFTGPARSETAAGCGFRTGLMPSTEVGAGWKRSLLAGEKLRPGQQVLSFLK